MQKVSRETGTFFCHFAFADDIMGTSQDADKIIIKKRGMAA